jgi:hypothetical protein
VAAGSSLGDLGCHPVLAAGWNVLLARYIIFPHETEAQMKADQDTILAFSLVMLVIVLLLGLGNTARKIIISILEWLKK